MWLALRRDTLAFIFQSFGLVPMLSAAENVGFRCVSRAAEVVGAAAGSNRCHREPRPRRHR
jgi:ABC-type lipoprotein export system ATPase subunit